jgi:CRISPR-associated protein Csb2
MPSRALLIEVRLLNGRYHGTGDWPPAPFRLFQALVAGAYGGRWRSERDDEKDAAFRWLERLRPPNIAVPPKIDARATTYFVPNNDLDAVGGDPRRISEIRAGKIVRPILFEADAPCLYAWPFDDDGAQAHQICALTERLHTLGHGIDAAFASARICDWNEAELLLARYGAVARPGAEGSAGDPFCPVAGSLESLKKRYNAGVARFAPQGDGRSAVILFRQPPKAQFRTVAYDRQPVYLLFDLRRSSDPDRFRVIPQERVAEVAKAVRNLAAQRLKTARQDRNDEIERLVVGHGAGPADIDRRVRFTPLPSIGFVQVDPSIRRLLVEIPPDCSIPLDDIEWAISAQGVPAFEDTILVRTEDDGMLRHYGVEGRGSRRWHTITPVVMPKRRGGRVSGAQRVLADTQAAAVVADALRHAGVDWRGSAIRVQIEPFRRKGTRADAFNPDRFSGRLRHVEVSFSKPVSGPLVIGDGRWVGLGIMAPVVEVPPAVHVFTIDPSEAPPLASRDTLIRALRRAVMARVDAEFRRVRERRGEPLPTFFTGHLPKGEPARSGQHEHLFFLADDADGDGRIDRLAVVSPHLADRTVPYDPDRRSNMRRDLNLLDWALAGFVMLRAGSAGAPRLARAPDLEDDDPIFGRASRWVSQWLYRPTRHPKGQDVKESIKADGIKECARRNLPHADVEVIEATEGPRGGISARLRLRFSSALRGPILLGRGSHFGEGLFRAE